MVELQKRADVDPVCPHCEQSVRVIWCREVKGFLGKRFVYFCSGCAKILGVSHRKGFWMG